MMMPKKAMRQMVEANQALFHHSFNTLTLFQEQTENMLAASLEQALKLPREGQRVLTEWFKTTHQGAELLKKTVDDGCQKLAAILG